MSNVSRRNFLEGAAAVGMLAALGGCGTSTDGSTSTAAGEKAPDAGSYPIDPDGDSVKAKWSSETMKDGWTKVTQDDAPTLGYTDGTGVNIIQVDGYAFKDLNRNGKLDLWEDWRQTPEARAESLAAELPIEFCEGLTIHDTTSALNDDNTDATAQNGENETDCIKNRYFRTILDRAVQQGTGTVNAHHHGQWVNNAQAVAEAQDYGVPISFSTDPSTLVGWSTNNLSYAATFDPDYVREVWKLQAKQYRSEGVTMLLGPQVDVASEPRWTRVSGTFGEDPALVRDIGKAVIDGCQSTYDDNGNDLGWGTDSLVSMIKHWPGDGAGEGGRESHNAAGEYTVYPNENFKTGLVGFIDGGFNLDGETGKASGVMGSYSVAYSDDGEYGELVGTAYSDYKMKLLRDTYGYDGTVSTDWRVTASSAWGMADVATDERYSLIYQNGIDTIGGDSSPDPASGYARLIEDVGADDAESIMRQHAQRVLLDHFLVGVFENGYVDTSLIADLFEGDDETNALLESHLKSIVMLKNKAGVIKKDGFGDKPTIYIPMTYTPTTTSRGVTTPASWGLPFKVEAAPEGVTIVTDTVGDPTGDGGAYAVSDIVRASAAEIAGCDFALVIVDSPTNGGGDVTNQDGSVTFQPISLQYGEYTADGASVRTQSISNVALDGIPANRSYYGQSYTATNTENLNTILDTVTLMGGKPVVVAVNVSNPLVFSEFEDKVDAILVGFGARQLSFIDIACGKTEPSALLPIQMPKDMDTVEAQAEDTPRDMDPYVDSEKNSYDFAFGLNWSGVIDDDRTAKYKVSPILKPETV